MDAPDTEAIARALRAVELPSLLLGTETIAVVLLDPGWRVVGANAAAQRLAGRSPAGASITSFVGEGQAEAFARWLREADGWAAHHWSMFPDSRQVPRDVRAAVHRVPDGLLLIAEPAASSEVVGALATVAESLANERRKLVREVSVLDRQSSEDPLTGLPNRRAVDARLAGAPDIGSSFSVVMVDVDRFKLLNDRFGHQAGDGVLQWVAARLRETARRTDLVARLGGEEFVAILPGADSAAAGAWAERARAAMAARPPAMVPVRVTASFGVAEWRPGETAAQVLGRADRALYAAKDAGRDRIVLDGQPLDDPVRTEPEVPAPLWGAQGIGCALVDDGVVRRANAALVALLGHALESTRAAELVTPEQRAAFGAWIAGVPSEWTRAVFALDVDGAPVAVDHAVWARRLDGHVQLVLEPAVTERAEVDRALLALVDDLVDVQRELGRRTRELEQALAAKEEAEHRVTALEELLPVCAWCRRIRDDSAGAWLPLERYLAHRGSAVTHGMCPDCADRSAADLAVVSD